MLQHTQKQIWQEQVLPLFGPSLRSRLQELDENWISIVEEIRLRPGGPLLVEGGGKQKWIPPNITAADLQETINLLSQYSYYAFTQQLAQGYITVSGGHRVGVAGRVALTDGMVSAMSEPGSLNFRVARQIVGVGRPVLPWLTQGERLYNTLILAPPRCGKTTLLRDLVRLISQEVGLTVGLVDERSEVAGSYRGLPQLDVGPRTDVLDGCPREQGLMMLIRSMGPQVVAADEIGREVDVLALENVLAAGVSVLTTAHARDLTEARQRPALRKLLDGECFGRIVILHRLGGKPGVAGVMDSDGKWLYGGEMG